MARTYEMGCSEYNTVNFCARLETIPEKNYMHIAIENNAAEILSYLLFDLKGDPNIPDSLGFTCLHLAALTSN